MYKADPLDYIGRYREVISDPINILINRVRNAGYVNEDNTITLHNGNKVVFAGELSYYDDYSNILILNRGVHEPLEEFCFQEVLRQIKQDYPVIIELGSYWAHYSMWFLQRFSNGIAYLVEPDIKNLNCGINNFKINNYSGTFINEGIGKGYLSVDSIIKKYNIDNVSILHCDIQGYEMEMLEECSISLRSQAIDYLFISTHNQEIHESAVDALKFFNYRIEVSSDFDFHTTSYDGFILASSPKAKQIFNNFNPLGRLEILQASSKEILESLNDISF
jgi:hypothetical protein